MMTWEVTPDRPFSSRDPKRQNCWAIVSSVFFQTSFFQKRFVSGTVFVAIIPTSVGMTNQSSPEQQAAFWPSDKFVFGRPDLVSNSIYWIIPVTHLDNELWQG
jgi:hypothetical protein